MLLSYFFSIYQLIKNLIYNKYSITSFKFRFLVLEIKINGKRFRVFLKLESLCRYIF